MDDERNAGEDEGAYHQKHDVHRIAADGNLVRRDEAHQEGRQAGQEAEAAPNPHAEGLASGNAESAGRIRFPVAQINAGGEHQHVHDEVQDDGKLGNNLVGGLHGRHDHEHDGKQGDDAALNEQDAHLDVVLVPLLHDGRQVASQAYLVQAFGRTSHPRCYLGQNAYGQRKRQNPVHPAEAEEAEVTVIRNQQALHQVDLGVRNDEADGQRAQNENEYRNDGGNQNGQRIVAAGVIHVLHMHGGHFHPCVEQEDAGGQNEVVEIAHVRYQLVPAHVQQNRVASGPIAQAQQNQDGARNDGSDDGAPFGNACGSLHAAQVEQGSCPVYTQHHDEHIPLVGGKSFIPSLSGSHESQGNGGEGQHGRKPDGAFNPLQPDGQEPPFFAEGFAYPTVNAAFLRPSGGEFRGYQGDGHQEKDRCKNIVKDGTESVRAFRRHAAQADNGGNVNHGERKYPHAKDGFYRRSVIGCNGTCWRGP